jgi:hypothetical protein
MAAGGVSRPSMTESHWSSGRASAKSMISSVKTVSEEKPVASGGGISVNVQLTEPVLFLRGFEQAEHAERSTAMLRGSLCLKLSKPAKLKAITLKFRGKATTKWPEGEFSTQCHGTMLIFVRHTPKEGRVRRSRYFDEPHMAILQLTISDCRKRHRCRPRRAIQRIWEPDRIAKQLVAKSYDKRGKSTNRGASVRATPPEVELR